MATMNFWRVGGNEQEAPRQNSTMSMGSVKILHLDFTFIL
jgi:hypothetical protein